MLNEPNSTEEGSPPEPAKAIAAESDNSIDEQTAEQENITPTPQTENMEVHHHAHHSHGKKTWKSYFWEFFMLFMAVFCGSLAELQVEHYIEHQREHKYAETLMEDLANDTLDLKNDIEGWTRMKNRADTIGFEIEKPDAERDHRLLYKCVAILNNNNTFLYHDRTIQQLKSSGNFRLIRNSAIADSIVEYDAWIQKTINDIENTYSRVMLPEVRKLENQLFNSKFFGVARDNARYDSALKQQPEIIFVRNGKEELLFEFYNKVNDYKGLAAARVFFLKMLLRKAHNLMAMLKKEYHLD